MATEAPTPETDELGSMADVLGALARTDGLAVLAPGTVIAGQYEIEERLGAGGMGVVFRARDRKLGRAVAIKVGRAVSPAGLRRIEREAMALAQLSHPNVVAVHQVGEVGGRVFIVMEHVAGTARSWLAARPRTWREILALYLEAGAGLAAAHAAGLVHRDFKPDNVLVGDDGRARVADFGLARTDGAAVAIDGAAALAGVATVEGAVQGTPAYMPPEQLAGSAVDARADQFAFAASLWEALFGGRPFGGATPDEVRRAIESRPPQAGRGPAARGTPRALTDALRRALAPHAGDRWPSMTALLRALARARDARRRRWIGAGALTAVAAIATALVIARRGAAVDPCTDGPARIARVWSPPRAAEVAARLPPPARARVVAALDAYAARWALAHRDACRATRVARSETEALLDRRTICLARGSAALAATVELFERGPAEATAGADALVAGLPDPGVCTSSTVVDEEPPPTDPARRALVDEAMAAVARADVGAVAWHDPEAGAKADAALALARRAGWRPEIARALVAVAVARTAVDDDAGAAGPLQEAVELAIASHSDDTAAIALGALADVHADTGHDGEATQAIALARAFVARSDDNAARVSVLTDATHVALTAERYDDAVAAARERIAIADARGDATARGLARLALGNALIAARSPADALAPADEARAILTEAHGPGDLDVASAWQELAVARTMLGQLDGADDAAARAIAIVEAALGPDARMLPALLQVRASVARSRGDRAGAAGLWQRALTLAEAAGDAEASVTTRVNLAILDLEAGEHARAVEQLARALAELERTRGTDSTRLIDVLVALGYGERALGRMVEARAHHERAVAIAAAHLDPAAPTRLNAQIELASTQIAAGAPAAAAALLAPLVAVVDEHAAELPPGQPDELRGVLARARAAVSGRPRRAAGP